MSTIYPPQHFSFRPTQRRPYKSVVLHINVFFLLPSEDLQILTLTRESNIVCKEYYFSSTFLCLPFDGCLLHQSVTQSRDYRAHLLILTAVVAESHLEFAFLGLRRFLWLCLAILILLPAL